MLLLFNSTNGYKYIQATAPNYNSVLYMGADGLHGDGVLSDGKTPSTALCAFLSPLWTV